MVSAAAGVIALVPGMPIIPFAAISIGAGVLAWRRVAGGQAPRRGRVEAAPVPSRPRSRSPPPWPSTTIKIELGYGLLPLINDLEGRRLTDQIKALRRTLAADFGFVMPPVRILDNMRLATQGYAIRIKEMEAGAGEVRLGSLMAMDPRGGQVDLPGEHVREPAFGLPATWIDESLREEATFRGYTIVDPATVLTTHLTEILKDNMADLLSYAEMQKLLKDLPPEQKKLVDDLIPSVVTATTVQRVLQALLRERVSIRDLPGHPGRHRRGRAAHRLGHQPGRARPRAAWPASSAGSTAATTAPCRSSPCRRTGSRPSPTPWSARARTSSWRWRRRGCRTSSAACARPSSAPPWPARPPVLLTSPQIRPYVRSIIERFRGQTVVMSQNEIHPRARLKTVGQV